MLRNPEKGFARGALRKFVANGAPNLREIASTSFHTSEEHCSKFESLFRTILCKCPLFQCPLLQISEIGRHLVGVWIGGVWNGHFPESENIFQRPKFPAKSWNFRRKSDFAKFQAPKLKNSEPEKMQFHTPSHSIPPLDSLLVEPLRGCWPCCWYPFPHTSVLQVMDS